MILIVGATGDLGGHVTRKLLEKGLPVHAMTRELRRAAALAAAGAEIVQGDVRDSDSLAVAMRGVNAVVSASHAMLGSGKGSVARVDDEGQRALIAAARKAGVSHFVFISALGASASHPVDFWRTKEKIEREVRAAGMAFTIIRPSAYMAMHAFTLLGKPVAQGKRVILFGPGRRPRNFVAAEDVAKLVVLALEDDTLRGQTIDVGGPENLSSLQVVELFERVSGRKAKVAHLPLSVVRVVSRLVQPIHAGVARVLKASAVMETMDQTFDSAQLARFPVVFTRLEDFARGALAKLGSRDV